MNIPNKKNITVMGYFVNRKYNSLKLFKDWLTNVRENYFPE